MTVSTGPPPTPEEREPLPSQVFCSYGREDVEIVRELVSGLRRRDLKVWVDLEGIPPSAPWRQKVFTAIEQCEAFMPVLSSAFLGSSVCAEELEHALEHRKRLIPVVCEDVEGIPPRVAELQFIYAREPTELEEAASRILTAYETDLDWLEAHTRLLRRALDWERRDEDPSVLQHRYVLQSARASASARLRWMGALLLALVITTSLAVAAWMQRNQKERQRNLAIARQLAAQAELVRTQEPDEIQLSVQLAAEAEKRFQKLGMHSLLADQALRLGLSRLARRMQAFDLGQESVTASAFQPDGSRVAVARAEAFEVWDVATGQLRHRVPYGFEREETVYGIALSADGELVATSSLSGSREGGDRRGRLAVWDLESGERRFDCPVERFRQLNAVRVTSDGHYLANRALVLHMPDCKVVRWWITPRDRSAIDVTFDPPSENALVLTGDGVRGWYVSRWRLADGRELDRFEVDQPGTLAFTDEGAWLGLGAQAQIQFVNLRFRSLKPRVGQGGRHWSAVVERNLFVRAREDLRTASLFEIDSGVRLLDLPHHQEIQALALVDQGRRILTLTPDDRQVRVWDGKSARDVGRIRFGGVVTTVAFDPVGDHLAVAGVGSSMLWSLQEEKPLAGPRFGLEPNGALGFDDEGHLVTVGEGDLRQLEDDARPRGDGDVFRRPALSPQARFVAAAGLEQRGDGSERQVRVWDLASRKVQGVLAHEHPVVGVTFCPGVLGLVTAQSLSATEAELLLWNLETVGVVRVLPLPELPSQPQDLLLGCSPDGARIAVGAGDRVYLLDPSREEPREILHSERFHEGVSALAWSRDGRFLATTGATDARIWLAESGEEVARLPETAGARGAAFNQDGTLIAIGGQERGIPTDATKWQGARLFWASREKLLEEACARLPASLPKDVWEEMISGEPYVATCGEPSR